MNVELRAPGDRYRLVIDVLSSSGSGLFTRHQAEKGISFWDMDWPEATAVASGSGGARPQSFMVVVEDLCSLVVIPGENGITVRWVRLMNANRATIRAQVFAESGAPDWLPPQGEYLIFDGDQGAAAAIKDHYIPLDGVALERSWPCPTPTPLDKLAVAVGRSVARANAALVRIQAAGGVALVSSITIRVGVQQTQLCQGRVLLTLARPEQGHADQFVELTMTTVPGSTCDEVLEPIEPCPPPAPWPPPKPPAV